MAQADTIERETPGTQPSSSRSRRRGADAPSPSPTANASPETKPQRGSTRANHRRHTSKEPEPAKTSPVEVIEPAANLEPEKPRRTRGSRGGRKHRPRPAQEPVAVAEAPPATKPERTNGRRRVALPEPPAAYDEAAGPKIGVAPARPRVPVTGAPTEVPPPFAHNAEYEFARILDFYGIAWEYEPRSFPLRWERGHVTEAFTPDFYLSDLNLFVELTTLKTGLTAEKNRKMRILKELFPDTNIILLKKRDYLRLLVKYGYGAIPPSQAPDIDRVLIPATRIQQRVQELGAEISKDYTGREPVLVGVLRGVLCFIADLMRNVSVPTSVDLMSISSYDGNGGAAVRILKDLDTNIKGRDVILVEDIVDTGMTLNHMLDYLQTKRPSSIKICTLLDKRVRRLVNVSLDYVGFEIPDEFVVGYGLDFNQRFRNLPFVGTLKHDLLP